MRPLPLSLVVAASLAARTSHAEPLAAVDSVDGAPIVDVRRDGASVRWSDLRATDVPSGPQRVSFATPVGAEAALVPPCAGRTRALLDGAPMTLRPGPAVLDLPRDGRGHEVTIVLDVSGYEHRVTCGTAPRAGRRVTTRDGLLPLDFDSPHARAGGGRAVVYVPPGHDASVGAALLVGLHPWNGGVWTYAAYAELLDAARAEDVVLLFPSGLGNSLYTADAEDEVLRAIDALEARLAVDPDRVSLFGASMGGAGATTVGFHHPDRFAAVVSLFGDSQYDLSTYVRGILHDAAGAHRVNALDVVDNARNLPVWLIHGDEDRVSPIRQSAILHRALAAQRFPVRFDAVPGAGHEGRVVREFASRIVDLAAASRRVAFPAHVTYRSVRPSDAGAYGVRIERKSPRGDAFIDILCDRDGVSLVRAEGVRAVHLARGALGTRPDAPPRAGGGQVPVTWDPPGDATSRAAGT